MLNVYLLCRGERRAFLRRECCFGHIADDIHGLLLSGCLRLGGNGVADFLLKLLFGFNQVEQI